jgi:hypothetical protein
MYTHIRHLEKDTSKEYRHTSVQVRHAGLNHPSRWRCRGIDLDGYRRLLLTCFKLMVAERERHGRERLQHRVQLRTGWDEWGMQLRYIVCGWVQKRDEAAN